MKLVWCDESCSLALLHILPPTFFFHNCTLSITAHHNIFMSQPLRHHPSLPPLPSTQTTDVIFGTALVTALPRHTQRKVPLLLAWYGPVICSRVLLVQNRCWLRLLQPQDRVTQWPLLPVKTQEVCQGVRGGDAERRGVLCELCVRLPGVLIFLHCNITEGTPLEGIWRQKKTHNKLQEQPGVKYEAVYHIHF